MFGMLPLLQMYLHTQLLLSYVNTIHQSCFSFFFLIICEVLIKIWSYKKPAMFFLQETQ